MPAREALSRGQAKLLALCCLMSQAQAHAREPGAGWPVIALDDLASELDRNHQRRTLDYLQASGAQVFITGTEPAHELAGRLETAAMFHVEHGVIAAVALP